MRLLLISLLLSLSPLCNYAAADQRSVLVEFSYTAVPEFKVVGYKLYQEGTPVCTTEEPTATTMDCDILIEKNATDFTLAAMLSNDQESPHSPVYTFVVDDLVPPDVPVAPPMILKMIIGGITVSH